jgi:hypothetical protein
MKKLLRHPLLIVVCAFGLAFSFFVAAALVVRIFFGGSEEAFWGATLCSMAFGAIVICLGLVYALSVAVDNRRKRVGREESNQASQPTPRSGVAEP